MSLSHFKFPFCQTHLLRCVRSHVALSPRLDGLGGIAQWALHLGITDDFGDLLFLDWHKVRIGFSRQFVISVTRDTSARHHNGLELLLLNPPYPVLLFDEYHLLIVSSDTALLLFPISRAREGSGLVALRALSLLEMSVEHLVVGLVLREGSVVPW